jgi:hypothetical protein
LCHTSLWRQYLTFIVVGHSFGGSAVAVSLMTHVTHYQYCPSPIIMLLTGIQSSMVTNWDTEDNKRCLGCLSVLASKQGLQSCGLDVSENRREGSILASVDAGQQSKLHWLLAIIRWHQKDKGKGRADTGCMGGSMAITARCEAPGTQTRLDQWMNVEQPPRSIDSDGSGGNF